MLRETGTTTCRRHPNRRRLKVRKKTAKNWKSLTTSVWALAAVAVGTAATAEAETLRYGSFVPARSSANSAGVLPMMKKIEAVTNGRVKFNVSLGGAILSPRNSLSGIRDGVVDSGFIVMAFYAKDLPNASMLSEFTGFGTDTWAALGALNEAYFLTCKKCREDFKKQGLAPLFMQSATPLNMVCRKPVRTTADLKGLKLSSIDTPGMRWGKRLGMTPRRQNFRQFVQAMQLGQTDCFLGPPAWIRSYGLTDVAKSVVSLPQGVVLGAVPMMFNAKSLAKISAEDRKAMASKMGAWVASYVDAAYVKSDAAVTKMLQGKVAFVAGDGNMKSAWDAHTKAEQAALVALAKRRNLTGGEDMVKRIAAVFRKWHEVHLPTFKDDPKKFGEVLQREVFDKVTY